MIDAAAAWGLGGVLAGALVTWIISRYYYLRAARERPDWVGPMVTEVVAESLRWLPLERRPSSPHAARHEETA